MEITRAFGNVPPKQSHLLAFSFEGDKWPSLSVFLFSFLSVSARMLNFKAIGIKKPLICILNPSLPAQHFRSQAQSFQQLKMPPHFIQPNVETADSGITELFSCTAFTVETSVRQTHFLNVLLWKRLGQINAFPVENDVHL